MARRGTASQTRSRVSRVMAATPFPSGPGGCAVQILRLPLHGTPGPKGGPETIEKKMPASRGAAHTPGHVKKSRGRWRTRRCVSCVLAAIRVDGLWPGWGADPQGIKPAVFVSSGLLCGCVRTSRVHGRGARRRRNTPSVGGRSFTHMPMVGRSVGGRWCRCARVGSQASLSFPRVPRQAPARRDGPVGSTQHPAVDTFAGRGQSREEINGVRQGDGSDEGRSY